MTTGELGLDELLEEAPLVRETGALVAVVAATGVEATGAGVGGGAAAGAGGAAAGELAPADAGAADAGAADPGWGGGVRFGGRRRWIVRCTTCVLTFGFKPAAEADAMVCVEAGGGAVLPSAQPPRPPSPAATATNAILLLISPVTDCSFEGVGASLRNAPQASGKGLAKSRQNFSGPG